MRNFSFVAHMDRFSVFEEKVENGYADYRVTCADQELGHISIPTHITPSVTVGKQGEVILYGGCSAYLSGDNGLKSFVEDEPIHSAWAFKGHLFLECDTSLIYRCLSDLTVVNKYDHDEIITKGIFKSSQIFAFQDLQNGLFELSIDNWTTKPSNYPFKKL